MEILAINMLSLVITTRRSVSASSRSHQLPENRHVGYTFQKKQQA